MISRNLLFPWHSWQITHSLTHSLCPLLLCWTRSTTIRGTYANGRLRYMNTCINNQISRVGWVSLPDSFLIHGVSSGILLDQHAGATSGKGTTYPSGAHACSFVFYVVFCSSLLFSLPFIIWLLWRLHFFDLWILITSLVSSNSFWSCLPFGMFSNWVIVIHTTLEHKLYPNARRRSSCSWSHGSWIYNYLWNQCPSPLTLWVRIPLRQGLLDTSLCYKVCQWLSTDRWSSPGAPVSSTNKSDRHDILITETGVEHHNHNPNLNFWM
jgi:hypothetical protein